MVEVIEYTYVVFFPFVSRQFIDNPVYVLSSVVEGRAGLIEVFDNMSSVLGRNK